MRYYILVPIQGKLLGVSSQRLRDSSTAPQVFVSLVNCSLMVTMEEFRDGKYAYIQWYYQYT